MKQNYLDGNAGNNMKDGYDRLKYAIMKQALTDLLEAKIGILKKEKLAENRYTVKDCERYVRVNMEEDGEYIINSIKGKTIEELTEILKRLRATYVVE